MDGLLISKKGQVLINLNQNENFKSLITNRVKVAFASKNRFIPKLENPGDTRTDFSQLFMFRGVKFALRFPEHACVIL